MAQQTDAITPAPSSKNATTAPWCRHRTHHAGLDDRRSHYLVYFIVREGREALHEARTGETCDCGEEERS
jgi:hypothetical protein